MLPQVKPHLPVHDVAYALLRAASRLFSTPSSTVLQARRRDESRRGTLECVRHIAPTGGQRFLPPRIGPTIENWSFFSTASTRSSRTRTSSPIENCLRFRSPITLRMFS